MVIDWVEILSLSSPRLIDVPCQGMALHLPKSCVSDSEHFLENHVTYWVRHDGLGLSRILLFSRSCHTDLRYSAF